MANQMTLIQKVARFVACEMIAGDYLEFGVYQGQSFLAAYKALSQAFQSRIDEIGANATQQQSHQRQQIWDAFRFIAFDSFEGLPELKGVDKDTKDFQPGQYAASTNEFEAKLDEHGVPVDSRVIVPGWFDETCTSATRERYQMKQAAVVWIDCDLYESAKTALSFLTPMLQDGTVIVFDDWYAYRGNPDRGEQRAFAEWLETIPDYSATPFQKEGVWRNSFIMSRRDH